MLKTAFVRKRTWQNLKNSSFSAQSIVTKRASEKRVRLWKQCRVEISLLFLLHVYNFTALLVSHLVELFSMLGREKGLQIFCSLKRVDYNRRRSRGTKYDVDICCWETLEVKWKHREMEKGSELVLCISFSPCFANGILRYQILVKLFAGKLVIEVYGAWKYRKTFMEKLWQMSVSILNYVLICYKYL